jgi:hypothetical protein
MSASFSATNWQTRLPHTYVAGVTVEGDSRKFVLEQQRITGTVRIGTGCSQYALRDLLIYGQLVIEGLNWHGLFSNVWVINETGTGIVVGANGPGGNCHALNFQNVFASGCAGKGWEVYQQSSLAMTTCAADRNVGGGFLFSGCKGDWRCLSAESNGAIGMHFYDSSGRLSGQYLDPADSLVINGDSHMIVD